MGIITVQMVILVEKKVQILEYIIRSTPGVSGTEQKGESTFKVSESVNDSILSSLVLVRKSLIPVSPQSTFALIMRSLKTRSPTSR